MYYDGQIITQTEYTKCANWINANGNKFEIEQNTDGTFVVKEAVIAEPTEYEKAQARIAELKELLAGTDYVVLKIAEGVATKEDYASVLDIRQQWREEINQLEATGENNEMAD
jgi:hypothetical protein